MVEKTSTLKTCWERMGKTNKLHEAQQWYYTILKRILLIKHLTVLLRKCSTSENEESQNHAEKLPSHIGYLHMPNMRTFRSNIATKWAAQHREVLDCQLLTWTTPTVLLETLLKLALVSNVNDEMWPILLGWGLLENYMYRTVSKHSVSRLVREEFSLF